MIKISLIGNKNGVYIDRNERAFVDYKKAVNYKSVNFEDVNNLVIKRDESGEMTIVQASGYSFDRGLFCDMY